MSEVTKTLPDGRTLIITTTGEMDQEAAAFINRYLPLAAEEIIQAAAEEIDESCRPL